MVEEVRISVAVVVVQVIPRTLFCLILLEAMLAMDGLK
jgi:hypothetical protein